MTIDRIPFKSSKSFQTSWRKIVNRLRKALPTELPVRVNVVRKLDSGYMGDIRKMEGYYHIRIVKGCTQCMFQTLAHEWAHACDSWETDHLEHNAAWGIWLARAYRVIMEESDEKGAE